MIDWNKPIRTVGEHLSARVINKDLKSKYPIVVATIWNSGLESITVCNIEGCYCGNQLFENISEKIYLNLYRYYDGSIGGCQNKTMEEGQKNCNCPEYIKTIEVEI